jgi:hypothetical protein
MLLSGFEIRVTAHTRARTISHILIRILTAS